MEQIFNKLVRDNVPRIIENKGEVAITRTLGDEEYRKELFKKLLEESKEVMDAPNHDNLIEELSDVLEVLKAIATLEGKTIEEITEIGVQKKLKRGGFDKRVFLERTYDKKD